jgi:pro-sigmaK processing inhibitor BofA
VPLKFDNNVITFLFVVVMLLSIVIALKTKMAKILKLAFQLIAGGAFLIVFNFLGNFVHIAIPLNPLTAFFTGLFQIPGIAFLLIIKYIIYP